MSIERARELLAHASAVRPRDTYYPGQGYGYGLRADEEARRDAHAQRMALIAEAMVQAVEGFDQREFSVPTTPCTPCKHCKGRGTVYIYGAAGTTACDGCNGAGVHRL
jgi:DnaJ-class molecular chaperone